MHEHTKLLTDGEAANLLRILPSRLKRLFKAGNIPYIALPDGEVRFDPRALWRWVQEHQ